MTENAVETMRKFIVENLNAEISADAVAAAAGYSARHGNRLFKGATGKSIGEYIRLLRLSAAAQQLAENKTSVLDAALAHRYDSHEGFSKAFSSAFGISPRAYRKGGRPIRYFIPYPVAIPETMFKRKEAPMSDIITATIAPRPARKLIILYSETGTDYWSFCQEKGCDWEGLLLSIPERLDIPAFLNLPKSMIPAGCAEGAVGVEVPADYAGEAPAGYEIVSLPQGEMLYFQSPPYAREDAFPEAIKSVFDAYEGYDPGLYGYSFGLDELPLFNFGAFQDKGARIAAPLKKTR